MTSKKAVLGSIVGGLLMVALALPVGAQPGEPFF